MKIAVYPRDPNPYQGLLHGAIRRQDPSIRMTYLLARVPRPIAALLFPVSALTHRLGGYRIVHVHWPAFSLPRRLPFSRRLSLLWFRFCIGTIRLLRYRLIWTVHNVVPHEHETSDDVAAARRIALTADAKIVHASQTLDQMAGLGLDTTGVSVIPHGNYLGAYPAFERPSQSRARLSIEAEEFMVLFFGNIRPYKGVNSLLEAFLAADLERGRLVVAGECLDRRSFLAIPGADDPRVSLHLDVVPDDRVATYYQAADVVCLPFASVTSSGSVILALSFGKPIIAPRLGALTGLPETVGWFYEPTHQGGLQRSLEAAAQSRVERERRGRAALAFAGTLSWERIAADTIEVYQAALGRASGRRRRGRILRDDPNPAGSRGVGRRRRPRSRLSKGRRRAALPVGAGER